MTPADTGMGPSETTVDIDGACQLGRMLAREFPIELSELAENIIEHLAPATYRYIVVSEYMFSKNVARPRKEPDEADRPKRRKFDKEL